MCGVFGAYSRSGKPVLEDIYLGLYALQHRGQLSAGVAWISDGSVHIKKGLGLVHEALSQSDLAAINTHTAIGHVRYATAGGTRLENSQPLGANCAQGPVAIAHNGNLTNSHGLSGYLENRGAIFHTSCDTETILQLIAHQPGVVQLEALETALSKIQGAYSLAVLFDNCLIAARDPWGFRPLVIGQKDDTVYVASESCALDILGAEMIRDVEPGEILVIDNRGIISRKMAHRPQRRCHCSFEYVYFARPDSMIDGNRKNTDICIACNWFCAKVEKVKPTARLTVTKSAVASHKSAIEPATGTWNSTCAVNRMTTTCTRTHSTACTARIACPATGSEEDSRRPRRTASMRTRTCAVTRAACGRTPTTWRSSARHCP